MVESKHLLKPSTTQTHTYIHMLDEKAKWQHRKSLNVSDTKPNQEKRWRLNRKTRKKFFFSLILFWLSFIASGVTIPFSVSQTKQNKNFLKRKKTKENRRWNHKRTFAHIVYIELQKMAQFSIGKLFLRCFKCTICTIQSLIFVQCDWRKGTPKKININQNC